MPHRKIRIKTEPWYIFRQKVVWVTSENGDGRAEKPRYDVPQGAGVENRYEAELTN